MRNVVDVFYRLFFRAGLACLIVSSLGARADTLQVSPVQAKIEQLLTQSESQKDLSLKQLLELQQGLPPEATLADQREALVSLIHLYLDNDLNEAAAHKIDELSALGERHNDNWTRAVALNYRAYLCRNGGRLEKAKAMIDEAIKLAASVNVKQLTSSVNSTAGMIDEDRGDFKSALKHQLLALENLEQGGLCRSAEIRHIMVLSDIGLLYLSLKNSALSLEYNQRATRLAEAIHAQNKLAMLSINRGNVYDAQKKFPEAIEAYSQALDMARATSFYRYEFLALNNLSDVNYRTGNYRKCLQYANESVRLSGKMTNVTYLALADVNVGLCKMGLGEVAVGASQVNQGLDLLRKADGKTTVELVLGQLASAYARAGLYRQAYQALSEQTAVALDMFGADRDRVVAEMQSRYDAIQREKQIEQLEQKSRLQTSEIRNKNLLEIIAVMAAVLALFLAISIYMLYLKVKHSNLHLRELNLKLEFQSKRDPLTGLLNRRAFYDSMKKRRKISERRQSGLQNAIHALVILDIDQFKLINDTFGHDVGDIVLIEVSHRLSGMMRENDKLMRWGGEEFLLFLNNVTQESLDVIVGRVLNVVGGTSIEVELQHLNVTVSIGYILLDQGEYLDANLDKSLKLADAALYKAKIAGRNRAIGIQTKGIENHDLDAMLTINLDELIRQDKVILTNIAGPAH